MVKICKEGSSLNVDTNRCRKNCNDTQEINPVNKKCRKKCNDTQERNVDTGRCRKIGKVGVVAKVPKVKVAKVPKVKEAKVPKVKVVKVPKVKVARVPKVKVAKVPVAVAEVPTVDNAVNSKVSVRVNSPPVVFLRNTNANGKIIVSFLKDKLLKNRFTIESRISFYNYLTNLLKDIEENECLEDKKYGKDKGYTVKNIINLLKIIGTPSAHGSIYLTSIANSFGGFTIASKLMKYSRDNMNEIKLMGMTNKTILEKKSRHFCLMYKYLICRRLNNNDKKKLIAINELAHGDIKTLLTPALFLDVDLVTNLLFQTFLSIATFQNTTNHIHKDCHYGNFLHMNNKDVGYYEYKHMNTTFYLKACPHNIMIYDYGLSAPLVDSLAPYDYLRIMNAFMDEKTQRGWIKLDETIHKDYLVVSDIFYFKFREVLYADNKTTQEYIAGIIKVMIDNGKDTLITTKPSKVINSSPYII